METSELLASVASDGQRMTEAGRAGLDAQVEHCPDWTVESLLGHVSQVYRFINAVVSAGDPESPPSLDAEDVPRGPAVVDYFGEKHAALVDTLDAADPDAPIWTWTPRRDAGYFFRRMAHESSIHRFDAENAVSPGIDSTTAVDSDLATDGINEVIEVGMQFSMRGPRSDCYPAGTLHLHRTDGEGEWLLADADGSLDVRHEHAKGDAAVRGPASALYLYLWGRGRDGVEVFGDQSVADAWAKVAP